MEFLEVVRKRRMVRSFTAEPVDAAALERIIDAGRRGPSAGYSQGVEFVVVTDPEMRARVGTRGEEWLRRAKMPNFVAQAQALIVVCTSATIYKERYRERDKRAAGAERDEEDFWLVPYCHTDAGAATMLLLLAAVNEGLGAGVAGVMGEGGQRHMREVLGVPENYTAVAIVALGHEAANAGAYRGSAATRRRRALSEVVHRERW
jgi:nitroreductase